MYECGFLFLNQLVVGRWWQDVSNVGHVCSELVCGKLLTPHYLFVTTDLAEKKRGMETMVSLDMDEVLLRMKDKTQRAKPFTGEDVIKAIL